MPGIIAGLTRTTRSVSTASDGESTLLKKSEKQLLTLYRSLPEDVRSNLLDFAQFLADRYPPESEAVIEPLSIPRPSEESVIAAVKRLSATYPMLNKDSMLHETSALVAQHLIQGRNATEVIDELEIIFRQRYQSLQSNEPGSDNNV
ncbi:MAG: Crp/Fnr family transcriptional regulator [Gammaproteobacteria bacterium]